MALDLPTLERPANATSGGPGGGRSAGPAGGSEKLRLREGLHPEGGNSNKIAPFDVRGPGDDPCMRARRRAASVAAAPALAQDAAKAQSIAEQVCAACHAADGNSIAAGQSRRSPASSRNTCTSSSPTSRRRAARSRRARTPIMTRHGGEPVRRRHEEPGRLLRRPEAKPAAAADKELAALGQKLWRGGNAADRRAGLRRLPRPDGRRHPGAVSARSRASTPSTSPPSSSAFKEGGRANDPNGMMRGVAARMSEREIQAVAEYAAGLR